jgi:hypothetical protein
VTRGLSPATDENGALSLTDQSIEDLAKNAAYCMAAVTSARDANDVTYKALEEARQAHADATEALNRGVAGLVRGFSTSAEAAEPE